MKNKLVNILTKNNKQLDKQQSNKKSQTQIPVWVLALPIIEKSIWRIGSFVIYVATLAFCVMNGIPIYTYIAVLPFLLKTALK